MVEPALAIGVIGAIILIGIILHQFSERFKFPHILILIFLGIIIGPILGLFDPSEYHSFIQGIVTFALIIVLFDAGYEIKFSRLKKEWTQALRLTIPAMVFSIAVAFLIGYYLLKLSWQNALLLGAIIASTDITIIAPLLKIFKIKPRLQDILNLEATINSAFAIVIATVVVSLFSAQEALYTATHTFLYQLFVGIGLGFVFGYMLVFVLRKTAIEQRPELISIGIVLMIYALSQLVGASGIFAVFVAGLILGNSPKIRLKKVIESFQSNIAFLVVVFIYVILGTMLKLNVFLTAGLVGILFAILIIASRAPAALCRRVKWHTEDKFIFFIGPRGMTCIVLALYYMYNFPVPDLILGLVFMTVLGSVILASVSHKLIKEEGVRTRKK